MPVRWNQYIDRWKKKITNEKKQKYKQNIWEIMGWIRITGYERMRQKKKWHPTLSKGDYCTKRGEGQKGIINTDHRRRHEGGGALNMNKHILEFGGSTSQTNQIKLCIKKPKKTHIRPHVTHYIHTTKHKLHHHNYSSCPVHYSTKQPDPTVL